MHAVIHAHSYSQTQPVVWKAAFSVWHWLLSANSTLGASLASFAANPGKEITETHNAVFCSSAKKKTSPLSPQKKGLYTNSHSPGPILAQNLESHTSPGTFQYMSRSRNKQHNSSHHFFSLSRSPLLLCITNTCIIQKGTWLTISPKVIIKLH